MAAEPKILVVDDTPANRDRYAGWLRDIRGVDVLEAAAGPRALALAREHAFALFVLDIHMPGMDGFELASLLRQEPGAEGTPIVFVTADATPRAALMRGYRMGAVDFMVWGPVEAEILVQKARVFIQMWQKRQELQEAVDQVRSENRLLHEQLQKFLAQQETWRMQATHDRLTRLPNRALFEDRLSAAAARAQRGRQRFALAYLDLDGFKAVNDLHGHAVGDALLASAARRMSGAVRATDTVARLGGDEFALLFEGLDSPAGAAYVAEKVHRALTAPHTVRAEADSPPVEVRTGASIGIALYPDHSRDCDGLVTHADMAMYAVKRSGGGVRVYRGDAAEAGARADAARLHLVRQRT